MGALGFFEGGGAGGEDVEEGVLGVADEVGAEGAGIGGVEGNYLLGTDILAVDVDLPADHGYGEAEVKSAVDELDADDGGFIAFVGSADDLHLVESLNALEGGAELEALAVVEASLEELPHDGIAYEGLMTGGVEVSAEANEGVEVFLGVDEVPYVFVGGLEEDEAAELHVGICLDGGLLLLGIGGFACVANTSSKKIVGIEGLDNGQSVAQAHGIDIGEPFLKACHLQMCHDMPLGKVCLSRNRGGC